MTTFNITRSNDETNSNILLLGIAVIAILAVVVAFAPALFSASTVAVENAPFGFNSPQDGNFQFNPAVPTFSDQRLDGIGGTTAAVYATSDDDGGWVVIPIPQTDSTPSIVVPCPFTPPAELDAAGNAVLGQVGNILVAYSSSANEVYFRSGGYQTILDLDTCVMSAKELVTD